MLNFVIIVCITGLFLQNVASATVKQDGIACNLGDTKYIPHANCSKFYVCDNGYLTELECPPSLYFNPELEVCDYPINVPECEGGTREPGYTPSSPPTPPISSTVTSTDSSTTPLPPTTSPTTEPPTSSTSVAPPTTRISTLPPETSTTTTTETPTTSTTVPPPSTTVSTVPPATSSSTPIEPSTTITSSSVPISTAPPIPNTCPTSGIDKIPHPSTCDRYLICVNGVPYEICCPDGLQFNPVEKECDIPENANCALTPELPSTTPPSYIPECPAEGVSLHPLPGNCTFYVQCVEGFSLIQKCADGTCFNEEHLICEAPADSDTQPGPSPSTDAKLICQDNKEEIKLYPSNGSCSEYHICFGEAHKGQQECKNGKHFHYFTQNCIPKEQSDCNYE